MLLLQGASLKSTANGELVYNLPTSEAKSFPALFEDLNQNKSRLDFLNLGLSVTTMEDVFLRYFLTNRDQFYQHSYLQFLR